MLGIGLRSAGLTVHGGDGANSAERPSVRGQGYGSGFAAGLELPLGSAEVRETIPA